MRVLIVAMLIAAGVGVAAADSARPAVRCHFRDGEILSAAKLNRACHTHSFYGGEQITAADLNSFCHTTKFRPGRLTAAELNAALCR
jgi:hypothetical protein